MSIKIDVNIPFNKLLGLLKYLDKNEIQYILDDDYIQILIKNKRVNELEYMISEQNYSIIEILNYNYKKDDIGMIKQLIKAYLENRDEDDIANMFFHAIDKWNIELIKIILDLYTDDVVALVNSDGGKPLLLALSLKKDSKEKVELLFGYGASVDECDHDPIIDALFNDDIIMVKYLLFKGSNLKNIQQKNLEKIFRKNCQCSIDFIINHLKNGELMYLKEINWSKCLKYISKNGNCEVLMELIEMDIGIEKIGCYDDLIKICEKNRHYGMAYFLQTLKTNEKFTKRQEDPGELKITKSGVSFKK